MSDAIKHTDNWGDSVVIEKVRDGSLMLTAIDGDTYETVYVSISADDFMAITERVKLLVEGGAK